MVAARLGMVAVVLCAAPSAALGQASLADSLRAFAFEMAAMLRYRDAAGTLRLYGDTAQFVHIDDGELIPWARMSAMVRRYLAEAESNPICVVGEPGVTIMDADNAVVYGNHHVGATPGRPAHGGIWTGVLHRFPTGWKIVHSHSSAIPSAGPLVWRGADHEPDARRGQRRPQRPGEVPEGLPSDQPADECL